MLVRLGRLPFDDLGESFVADVAVVGLCFGGGQMVLGYSGIAIAWE